MDDILNYIKRNRTSMRSYPPYYGPINNEVMLYLKQTPKRHVFPRDPLCAQNMLIILSSTINIIKGGRAYHHLTSTRIYTLITIKIFIRDPQIMRQMAMNTILIANHPPSMMCNSYPTRSGCKASHIP